MEIRAIDPEEASFPDPAYPQLKNFIKRSKTQPYELMLYTIALILIIAWLLGLVSSYTLGGFIHILLVLAIIAVLVRLIQGRPID